MSDTAKMIALIKSLGSSSGSGLPTGGAAHQMLVTDAEGKAEWQDRTHYTTTGVVDILPESAWVIEADNAMSFTPLPVGIVTGQTYTLTINGVEYEREALTITMSGIEIQGFGNIGALDGVTPVTEDTFVLMLMPEGMIEESGGMTAQIMFLDGAEITSVSLRGEAEVVKKLDAKYAPGYVFGYFPFENRVFLPETTYAITDGYALIHLFKNPLVVGNTYTVSYNGTDYTLVARAMGSAIVLGRIDGSTDEPLGIQYNPAGVTIVDGAVQYGLLRIWDGSTSATVSVIGSGTDIKKVPKALLEVAEPFVVTVVHDGSTNIESISHTYDEIMAEYKAGRAVFCHLVNESSSGTTAHFMPLAYHSTYMGAFIFQSALWGGKENYRVQISDTNGNKLESIDPSFSSMELTSSTGSLILTSPFGTRFRVTVSDDGTLSATAL